MLLWLWERLSQGMDAIEFALIVFACEVYHSADAADDIGLLYFSSCGVSGVVLVQPVESTSSSQSSELCGVPPWIDDELE
jgi:hypothetical protein